MKKSAPPVLSLIKSFKFFGADPLNYLMAISQLASIIKFPLENRYLVNSPDAVQKILQTHFANYTKVGTNYERLKKGLGPGLLTNSGKTWEKRRADLQPMMFYKNLAQFTDIINDYTQATLNDWEKKITERPYFNLAPELLILVAKISAAVLFGLEISAQTATAVRLVTIGNSFIAKSISLARWYPTLGNLRFQHSQKKLDDLLLSAFKYHTNPAITHPLLQTVVEDYQNDVIRQEDFLGDVKNFFVAGHETTGNALSWTFYCLMQNPPVLEKLQQEITSVLGKRTIGFEQIAELPYTDKIFNEALRLYPPIWVIERKALTEDDLGDYVIPAGANVVISPYTLQRDPHYWENPKIFDPERFSSESPQRNKFAYIPFGTGPRVCIGKQLAMMIAKIILPSIVQRFDIKLAQHQQVKPEALVTLRPKGGLWVSIKNRM